MALSTKIDWRAVGTGAVVVIAVGVAVSVSANVIDLSDDPPPMRTIPHE